MTYLVDAGNNRRYYYNYNLPRFVICGGWQVLCEYNGSDEFQQWYAYGNYIDEVLVMGSGIFASTARFYINDHLYSPVALTDYSGSVLERYEYDAYGNPTIWNADFTIERANSNYGNPYYFQGKHLDLLDNGDLELMLWPYGILHISVRTMSLRMTFCSQVGILLPQPMIIGF